MAKKLPRVLFFFFGIYTSHKYLLRIPTHTHTHTLKEKGFSSSTGAPNSPAQTCLVSSHLEIKSHIKLK